MIILPFSVIVKETVLTLLHNQLAGLGLTPIGGKFQDVVLGVASLACQI